MSYKYKWTGRNYDSSLSKSDIVKKLRLYLKTDEDLRQCKWSVTQNKGGWTTSIRVRLMSAPFEAFTEPHRDVATDVKYTKEFLTNEAMRVMDKVIDYLESFNFDDSDVMTDYFHVNFYTDYSVGSFEKPFVKTEVKTKRVTSPCEELKGLHYVDYSEKSFAIIGETKDVEELLRFFGGHPNAKLFCGAGWIFPKDKEQVVREFLNIK